MSSRNRRNTALASVVVAIACLSGCGSTVRMSTVQAQPGAQSDGLSAGQASTAPGGGIQTSGGARSNGITSGPGGVTVTGPGGGPRSTSGSGVSASSSGQVVGPIQV